MRHLSFLFFFISGIAFSQVGMQKWRLYTPANKPVDITYGASKVYVAMENGLYEYDIATGVHFLWTKANFLSDISLSAVEYDENSKTLIVGYKNGNIDLIQNNTVYNMPDILLSSVMGNKQINEILPIGDYVYVSSNFGIVKINPNKKEITSTFYPSANNSAILDIAFLNDSIYALTSDTIYKANINNSVLASYTQWQSMNIPTQATGSYKFLEAANNTLMLGYNHPSYGLDSVYFYENGVFSPKNGAFINHEVESITPKKDGFILSSLGSVYEFDANGAQIENVYQYDEGTYVQPIKAIKIGLDFYIADLELGLVKARNSYSHEYLGFDGPLRNAFYDLDWKNGQLAVACGALDGNQNTYNQDGVQLFEEEKWKNLNPYNQPVMNNTWDFVSVSIDPNDANHVVCGMYSSKGMLEMTDGENFSTAYDSVNSTIVLNNLGNGAYYVNDVCFDNESNCWVGQSYVNKPLKVMTADGTWYAFECGSAVKTQRLNNLQIDFNGIKWLSFLNAGLLAYDDNGTITDPSDDRYKLLKKGVGQGDLPSNNVLCATADYDNKIWIGTDFGLVVLYDVEKIFNTDGTNFDAKKILIEIDGEVESLLGETIINDIEVDGANRKWIATAGSGVLLLSPDGMEQIYRFTTENSPLITNTVLDIAINDKTGEVYFATTNGLISFRSDASFGDPDYKNVIVFPNPVRPNYTGPVTIQGIAYNSDVKITDMAGNLVYQTTSNGGTAVWNGYTFDGKRAKSGVYMIWTMANDAKGLKGRKVGKVVFINGEN